MSTAGIFLLTFSTWQYSVAVPQCCQVHHNMSSVVGWSGQMETQNWSSSCSELHKIVPLAHVDLHMSTELMVVLTTLGLIVSLGQKA